MLASSFVYAWPWVLPDEDDALSALTEGVGLEEYKSMQDGSSFGYIRTLYMGKSIGRQEDGKHI